MIINNFQYLQNDTIPAGKGPISKDAYAMRIDVSALASGTVACNYSFPSLFISDAASCDCVLPGYVAAHKIRSLKILVIDDSDKTSPGRDVTDQFKYDATFHQPGVDKKYLSINELVLRYFPYPRERSYTLFDGRLQSSVVLFLTDPSGLNGSYLFKVVITMDDDSVIEQMSQPIHLQ